jgi:hypothetical protein
VRRLHGLAVLCLAAGAVLHGCGGYDPIEVGELRIHSVSVTEAPRGVNVNWRTTDPASSRIDYGPAESALQTFYQPEKNGIGLDCDRHIMSETRTNCSFTGPMVNSIFDAHLVTFHSLNATEATTTTTTYLAIASQNERGQIATFTVTLPKPNPLAQGHPGTR